MFNFPQIENPNQFFYLFFPESNLLPKSKSHFHQFNTHSFNSIFEDINLCIVHVQSYNLHLCQRTFNFQELEPRVFSYLLENSISKF